MVLYLDVLLAVNWVIDFLLLHLLARIGRTPCRGWRLVAGGGVGAAGCLIVLLPDLPVIPSLLVKGVTALAMTAAAFGPRPVKGWLKQTGLLFLLSAGAAGAAVALWWLAAPPGLAVVNGVVYFDVSPVVLILSVAVAYGAMALAGRYVRRKRRRGALTLLVEKGGRRVAIPALYDTGNRLTEPFSGMPAAVVGYGAVAPLLTPDWGPGGPLPPPGGRLIPFSSVGGGGMLAAFRPDSLTLAGEEGERGVTGAWVAVSHRLGPETGALVGPDLFGKE